MTFPSALAALYFSAAIIKINNVLKGLGIQLCLNVIDSRLILSFVYYVYVST